MYIKVSLSHTDVLAISVIVCYMAYIFSLKKITKVTQKVGMYIKLKKKSLPPPIN